MSSSPYYSKGRCNPQANPVEAALSCPREQQRRVWPLHFIGLCVLQTTMERKAKYLWWRGKVQKRKQQPGKWNLSAPGRCFKNNNGIRPWSRIESGICPEDATYEQAWAHWWNCSVEAIPVNMMSTGWKEQYVQMPYFKSSALVGKRKYLQSPKQRPAIFFSKPF